MDAILDGRFEETQSEVVKYKGRTFLIFPHFSEIADNHAQIETNVTIVKELPQEISKEIVY
ncbi:hypothetical protein MASR2M78_29240 [Treponema sp.]